MVKVMAAVLATALTLINVGTPVTVPAWHGGRRALLSAPAEKTGDSPYGKNGGGEPDRRTRW
jgi:hypothetical protein